jgi:hypothetical protein
MWFKPQQIFYMSRGHHQNSEARITIKEWLEIYASSWLLWNTQFLQKFHIVTEDGSDKNPALFIRVWYMIKFNMFPLPD